jgi:hypothetical protein
MKHAWVKAKVTETADAQKVVCMVCRKMFPSRKDAKESTCEGVPK